MSGQETHMPSPVEPYISNDYFKIQVMVIILKNNNRLKNILASDGDILFRRILIWAMMMIWIKIHKIKIKNPIKNPWNDDSG